MVSLCAWRMRLPPSLAGHRLLLLGLIGLGRIVLPHGALRVPKQRAVAGPVPARIASCGPVRGGSSCRTADRANAINCCASNARAIRVAVFSERSSVAVLAPRMVSQNRSTAASLRFVMEYGLWGWLALVAWWGVRTTLEARPNGKPLGFLRQQLSLLCVLGVQLFHFCYYTFVIGGDVFEYRVYGHLPPLAFLSAIWMLGALRCSLRKTALVMFA